MKKNKLVASFEFDFSLLAIVSQLKEYKMAWYLNEELGISLIKQADVVFQFIDSVKLYISNYKYETEHNSVRLLINRSLEESSSTKRHLIPELKQFDYLMLMEGTDDNLDPFITRNHLRNVPGIQLISVIEVEPLKSKENLIF